MNGMNLQEFNGLGVADRDRVWCFWTCCQCRTERNPMPGGDRMRACRNRGGGGVRPCAHDPVGLDHHLGPCQCPPARPSAVPASKTAGPEPPRSDPIAGG
ncbi:hypothetical protein CTA1_6828 [Colletotrichum tanaceti]|uniref:Uncharacterized protein n=1 Tax=Colletotrichum tanaceti TaxID=1306861 RepID=A0A4U6X0C5_9PEZI|nr:hypothetical protein CTA1_6828 [Colletotrichum tanaceti]